MDLAQQQRIRPYLQPRERLIWSGRPVQGPVFRRDDLWLVPASLAVTWFAVDWNATMWSMGGAEDLSFGFHGALLLLGAFYFAIGRFIHDAWLRGRTYYAITDQRLIFLQRGLFGRFRSIALGHLPLLDYEEYGDGRGTITFDFDPNERPSPWANHLRAWAPSRAPRFDQIDEPRVVYDLIIRETERWRDAQYGAAADPALSAWLGKAPKR
jgi:hypothetical protein